MSPDTLPRLGRRETNTPSTEVHVLAGALVPPPRRHMKAGTESPKRLIHGFDGGCTGPREPKHRHAEVAYWQIVTMHV